MRKFPEKFGIVEEVVKKFDEHSYETQLLCNRVVEIPDGFEVVACLPHFFNPTGLGDCPKSIIVVEGPKTLPDTLKITYLSASFDPETQNQNTLEETNFAFGTNYLCHILNGFVDSKEEPLISWDDIVDYVFRNNNTFK